jgi:transposase
MSETAACWSVGIDVGVKSAHKVAILDRRTGERIRRSLSVPRTWEGIQRLLEILSEADDVVVAIEPAGNAWRPLAGVLLAADVPVYLVDPAKSSRLRKAFSSHAKSDRIDAEALARLPMVAPDRLDRLRVPPSSTVRLRDLVRHRDRLVEMTSARKKRIQAAVDQIQPTLMEALGDDRFLRAYRAFLRRYVDPGAVVRLGQQRLHRFLESRHRGPFDLQRTEGIFCAAVSGARLLEVQQRGRGTFFDPTQIQLEVCLELDLLEAEEGQIHQLEARIAALCQELDPQGLLQTMPGFGPIIAAGVLGETGSVDRFPNVSSYRGYVSLIPRYKATGQSHNPRQKLRKAGPRILKKYLFLAAENARKCDLELAAFYSRLRHKGRVHDQAVCAVANKLAGRAYAVMRRIAEGGVTAYVYRDLDGQPISKQEASGRVRSAFPGPVAQRQRETPTGPPQDPLLQPPPETKARRPSQACARPSKSNASSLGHRAPYHVSAILANGVRQRTTSTPPPPTDGPPSNPPCGGRHRLAST